MATRRRGADRQWFTACVAQRFVGEICGFGTAAGVRIVIGSWSTSPLGPFADAMVEQPNGCRVLIAPTTRVAELVAGVYAFDDVVVDQVHTSRSTGQFGFVGGPLRAALTIGERGLLGWMLRCIPPRLASSVPWATVVDPIARLTMRGVRTRGSTPGGRETYGATDRHVLSSARATWNQVDLGPLADLDPPVRFGFGSAPRRPSIVAVTTTIRPPR